MSICAARRQPAAWRCISYPNTSSLTFYSILVAACSNAGRTFVQEITKRSPIPFLPGSNWPVPERRACRTQVVAGAVLLLCRVAGRRVGIDYGVELGAILPDKVGQLSSRIEGTRLIT